MSQLETLYKEEWFQNIHLLKTWEIYNNYKISFEIFKISASLLLLTLALLLKVLILKTWV